MGYDLRTIEIPGVRHPFFLRPETSDMPTYQQVFERRDYDFTPEREPTTIVDAGANIGLASIHFANQYPQARIIAIEPEAGNHALLEENAAPYENVTVLRAALWGRAGQVCVVDPGLGHWGYMTEEDSEADDAPGESREQVRAVTVDGVMDEYGLEQIDILKIDIEGAECEVFRDPSAWIDDVRSIIVELHERMKPGCETSFKVVSAAFARQWRHNENVFLAR